MNSLAKKLMVALIAAFTMNAAVAAVDSYLYWMVSDAHQKNGEDAYFDYATIKSYDGTDYLTLGLYSGNTSLGTALVADETRLSTAGGAYAGFDSSGSVASFLVELWSFSNTDNMPVGYVEFVYDYAAMLAAGNIASSTQAGGATPLVVSEVVPEPTSGLLMLFGLAGLALRRKRA